MEIKNKKYYFLIGTISYIGFIQIIQILLYLIEFITFSLSQSVKITLFSSIIFYMFCLAFIIFFLGKKKRFFYKFINQKTLFIIIIFVAVYVIAEIIQIFYVKIVLSKIIENFPQEKADYILFSSSFFNLFNVLLIIILLIFTYKTRIKNTNYI